MGDESEAPADGGQGQGVPGEHVLLGGKHKGKTVAVIGGFDVPHLKWVSTHAKDPSDRAAARQYIAAIKSSDPPAPAASQPPAAGTATPSAAASTEASAEAAPAAAPAAPAAPAASNAEAEPMSPEALQAVLDANPALAQALHTHLGVPTVTPQPGASGFDIPPGPGVVTPGAQHPAFAGAPAQPTQQAPYAPSPQPVNPQHQLTPYQVQMLQASRAGGVGEVAKLMVEADQQRHAAGAFDNLLQGGAVPEKEKGAVQLGEGGMPAQQPQQGAPAGQVPPAAAPNPAHTYEHAVQATQGQIVQPPTEPLPAGVQVIEVKEGSSVLTPWGTVRAGAGVRMCSDDPLIYCTYENKVFDERHKFWVSSDQTSPLTPVADPVIARQLAGMQYHRYIQVHQPAPIEPPPQPAGAPPALGAPPAVGSPHGTMQVPARF